MSRVRALIIAGHPGPSLAITVLAALLAAQAAHGAAAPVLAAPAMLALQLSIGWSNDAFDARRDREAGRDGKPVAAGAIGARPVWIAAGAALAAALAMALALGRSVLAVTAVMAAAGWAYNAGLKSAAWSGLTYLIGFGLIPAWATAALPGHPRPSWQATAAAALVGLGAHFANTLPDLAGDRATGVRGLPQRVAGRWGPGAVRGCALALLLAVSVLLLIAAAPGRRWAAAAGLACSAVLAAAGARARGRRPFLAAIGIAAIDVALFAAGVEALTRSSLT
jgi:4-hydroxybenzoate polyprenyltransferase